MKKQIKTNGFGSRQMKGFEPLVAAVLLIAIALMMAIIVFQWQISFTHGYSEDLDDQTKHQLLCDRADISLLNISYDCANSCNEGTGHILDIKLRNHGDVAIKIEKIYLKNTSGKLFEYPGTKLEVGETKNIVNSSISSCHGINQKIEEILVITECKNLFLSIPGDKINWNNCPA